MRNVLLVALGSTARADCLAQAIAASRDTQLFTYLAHPNPSVIAHSKRHKLGKAEDLASLQSFAKEVGATLAFISPEAPLAVGVVDALEQIGVPCASPLKSLARLESSKSFTRDLLAKYEIAGSPDYRVFSSMDGVQDYLEDLGRFVIKPDGLTGGKGVKVQGDHLQGVEDGLEYCRELFQSGAGARVVIEEKMEGEEFSVQFLTDGTTLVPCPVVQDHKRAFVGDLGPNTGGMGSYSSPNHLLPFLTSQDLQEATEITQAVLDAVKKECGKPFKGILYGGFMATADGVRLIEYNVRFGDPEVMNVVPLLKTDFVDVLTAMANGTLSQISVAFDSKASVCKYAVPEGYPSNPKKGEAIDLTSTLQLAQIKGPSLRVFLGSVEAIPGADRANLKMGASRAVACVGIASSQEEAEAIAEEAVRRIKGPVFHRKDIGTKVLIDKRVEHMKAIRKN